MADSRHNPNMMVHSTNGIVDTTSGHNHDDNHNIVNNNNHRSGGAGANILDRAINSVGIIVSDSSSSAASSSSTLPSASASSSSTSSLSTAHALPDSVMIPFSASDLDALRASLATNSLNNAGVVSSNQPNNINVCINAGNIILNADGHLTLDGASAVLNGISSSSMGGNLSTGGVSSDLLHSNSNEITSNSGMDQHRLGVVTGGQHNFLSTSNINNGNNNRSNIANCNILRNSLSNDNDSNNNNDDGMLSTQNPVSMANILANVSVDESGNVSAPNGFISGDMNQGSETLDQNYMTFRNQQVCLVDSNNGVGLSNNRNNNSSNIGAKSSFKTNRSFLSGGNSLLQQQLVKHDTSGQSGHHPFGVVGSSSSSSSNGGRGDGGSGGGNEVGGSNGSSMIALTATANIHHRASASSSGNNNSNGRISLSRMNLAGRVGSSDTFSRENSTTLEVHAGNTQGQGQAGSSSSSIWLQQPNQSHTFPTTSQTAGIAIGVGSSARGSSSSSTVDPHHGLVSISIGDPQQQIVHMGSTNNSFQSQNQFNGLFQIPVQQEERSETFQAAAHSTFDQAGPSNVVQYRDLGVGVGGDSEATPSYSSMQQHQMMSSDNNIADSLNVAPTVDSSTLQGYNLVFDAETRKITVQRVISPSDSTVSQSTLSLEGSEATPNPAMMPMASQGYAMVQVNPMPSGFSQRGSATGGEVSTSSIGVVLDVDDRASSSAGGSLDGGLSSSQNIVVLHKLEDSGLDDATECDTTQEDLEFQQPQSPALYAMPGTSNSIDDDVTSLDSSTPDAPASSLTHRVINQHLLRAHGSSSAVDVMDSALNSSGLAVVSMDTSQSVIDLDDVQVPLPTSSSSSLSSSSSTAAATVSASSSSSSSSTSMLQHQHLLQHQKGNRVQPDVLPSTSGLQAYDAAVAGPSRMFQTTPANQQDETLPQSSGLGMHIRKSRRLELQGQEPRASQRKKENSYRTQTYSTNQIWCDECMLSYDIECPIHRVCPVLDKVVLSRAWASCPTQLQICRLVDTSQDTGESAMGVFARRQIGKLTQFGPLVGRLVDTLDEVATSQFPLMLELEDGDRKYYDTNDENLCNWMMFVRPAQAFAQQNVVAFQYKENIYFTVTKMIEAKQELKVWYAAHYAERLGLKPLDLTEEDMQALDEVDAKFPCFECSRRFRSSAALQKHLEMVHENDDLLTLNIDDDGGSGGGDGTGNGVVDDDEMDEDFNGDGRVNGMNRRRGKRKGVMLQGRLLQGKGRNRQRDSFQWKKKSTSLYLNKTLKKYKRRAHCSDKGPLSGRSSMYTRQGKDNGGNEWVCTYCGLTFDKRSLLNLHTLTHAAEDLVAGEEGMQIGQATSELGQDETKQEDGVASLNTIMACPKCAVIFTDQRQLMNHVATHAQKQIQREKPYDCQSCSKSFSTEEKLVKHNIVHGKDEDKPLECTVCQKRLVNNAAMACHMKTHSGRKYYDCPVCDESFDSTLERKEHAQKLHVDINGHYPCPNCVKVFEDFQMLKRHVKAFHSTRIFECEYCSKEFPRLDKLKLHLLKHTTHREFMCDQCGRQFKRKDKLKEHTKRLHSQERTELQIKKEGQSMKKFVPKVMPSEYHRFIYKCHTCLLGFKRRGMLVNHLAKRHPEMKPEHVPELNLPILKTQKDFYCQYCDKIYKSSSKRKAHIIKNHPGSMVPPSARKKLPVIEDGSSAGINVSLLSGTTQQVLGLNTFSHTVGSITTMPHGCKFCHKQYASKAKLLQHQRKKHTELVEPSSAKKKPKPIKSEYLQITVGDPNVGSLINDRYETVPMVTVVAQSAAGGDQLTAPADLLTQAMTELQQSYGNDFASTINPRLTSGNNNTTMQVQIQPSPLAQTIDINQLNQALQSMTSSQGGVTTVLAPPHNHTSIITQQQQQQQQHHHQEQQHQLQLVTNSTSQPSQLQQGVQLVAAGGPVGGQNTINLNSVGGNQYVTRTWPTTFTTQFS